VIGLLFVAPILALIVAFLGAVAIGILVSRGSSGPPAPAPPPPVEPPTSVAAILSSAGSRNISKTSRRCISGS
jgi:hypothetical protein